MGHVGAYSPWPLLTECPLLSTTVCLGQIPNPDDILEQEREKKMSREQLRE